MTISSMEWIVMLVQMAFQTHIIVVTICLIVYSSFMVLFEVRFAGG